MTIPTLRAVGLAMLVGLSTVEAQAPVATEPMVRASRVAFFVPPAASRETLLLRAPIRRCGSHLKNAAMLALGASLAVATLELTYTIIREPLVRNGHDLSPADPTLIAWAGGAGFITGLIGTEWCRHRHR